MSKKTKIEQVRALLSDASKWSKQCASRDAEGNRTDARHPTAFSWSLFGAFRKITENDADVFHDKEYKEFGTFLKKWMVENYKEVDYLDYPYPISYFNDHSETTFEKVARALDDAIAQQKAKG